MMEWFVADPDHAVDEYLSGVIAGDERLTLSDSGVVMRRRDPGEPMRVAVISGGGSGHEPAHAGYVGHGLLSAAVCGPVFVSPSVDAVLDAIRECSDATGVVLIVKNYSGDRLNFGIAAELARAEGIPVETVVVADDVALAGQEGASGRRGLAGTLLVHKVAGAAAATGSTLEQVVSVASRVAAGLRTIGVASSDAHRPGTSRTKSRIPDGHFEWGLGIHGEPGMSSTPAVALDELIERIVTALVTRQEGPLRRAAVVVNDLGGLTELELGSIQHRLLVRLHDAGVTVERLWSGRWLTALDMRGFSVSVLPLDAQVLELLDAPAKALAWRDASRPQLPLKRAQSRSTLNRAARDPAAATASVSAQALLASVAQALIDAEPLLTELDTSVGDGDLGESLSRGARALSSHRAHLPACADDILREMSTIARQTVGGSSGPLYAALLLKAATVLNPLPSVMNWAEAFLAGVDELSALGGARAGDCTMIDALWPAAQALAANAHAGLAIAVQNAAEAAERGAIATSDLTAEIGRASYVGRRAIGHPDPGAVAVSIWLRAIATHLMEAAHPTSHAIHDQQQGA